MNVDFLLVLIFVFIGAIGRVLSHFVYKVIKYHYTINDFEPKYLYSALVATLWGVFLSEAFLLLVETSGEYSLPVLIIISIIIGYFGEDAQEILAKSGLLVLKRRQENSSPVQD